MRHDFQLLDCTLRDGGYQTGWAFSDDMLADYLQLAAAMKLAAIELGYLKLDAGGHAATTGSFKDVPGGFTSRQKEILSASPRLTVAAMVDARQVADLGPEAGAQLILDTIAQAPLRITAIRIATTVDQLAHAGAVAGHLIQHGISAMINLMQAADLPLPELDVALSRHLPSVPLTVLYFADSFGRMRPGEVSALFKAAREMTRIPLGFHAHDNLGLGVANVKAALEAGASYVDATFGGLGRGAGNAATESVYLLQERQDDGSVLAQCELFLARHIEPLRASLKWGSSPTYRCQARAGVHPTYAQRLLERQQLSDIDRIDILGRLSLHRSARKFDPDALNSFM